MVKPRFPIVENSHLIGHFLIFALVISFSTTHGKAHVSPTATDIAPAGIEPLGAMGENSACLGEAVRCVQFRGTACEIELHLGPPLAKPRRPGLRPRLPPLRPCSERVSRGSRTSLPRWREGQEVSGATLWRCGCGLSSHREAKQV